MIELIPKYHRLGEGFSKQEKLQALEHPGRNTNIKGYQSPASWITDLTDLKKCILLCADCKIKFNHKKHHYRPVFVPDHTGKTSGFTTNGICDACKKLTVNTWGGGTSYVREEYYNQICVEPVSHRRLQRVKYYAKRVSAFLGIY